MKTKPRCQECKQYLSVDTFECTCGWRVPQEDSGRANDYRCHYRHAGRRCPLPGGISAAMRGDGSWYCAGHWSGLSEHIVSELALKDAEENYY